MTGRRRTAGPMTRAGLEAASERVVRLLMRECNGPAEAMGVLLHGLVLVGMVLKQLPPAAPELAAEVKAIEAGVLDPILAVVEAWATRRRDDGGAIH